MREFELPHSNPLSRVLKITHAHNLHVKMLDFVPFTVGTQRNANCWLEKLLIRFKESPRLYQHPQFDYASCNVKVDSLTFIYFLENYQTAEIYFYSYHVIPFNETIPNNFVN